MLYVSAEPGDRLFLGRAGENMARTIRLDIAPWRELYGDGIVALLLRRPGERDPYPCVIGTEGSTVIWPITLAETERPGTTGQYELQYRVGDQLVKSAHGGVTVYDALGQPGEEPPEPQQGWVDQVLEAGARAEAAVGDAGKQAVAAEASAARAEAAAGDAEKQAAAAETSAAEIVEAAIYAGKQAVAAEASAKEAEAAAGETVRYTPQELTVEQQAQARENIGVGPTIVVSYWANGGVDDIMELVSKYWGIAVADPLQGAQVILLDKGNQIFDYNHERSRYYPPLNKWYDGPYPPYTVRRIDFDAMFFYATLELVDQQGNVFISADVGRGNPLPTWKGYLDKVYWVTLEQNGDTWTSDTTAAEIYNLTKDGWTVRAVLDRNYGITRFGVLTEVVDGGGNIPWYSAIFKSHTGRRFETCYVVSVLTEGTLTDGKYDTTVDVSKDNDDIYATITKNEDGTYKSDKPSRELHSVLNRGSLVYAKLGSEIAHLRDVDTAQDTVTFDLPIVHDTSGSEGVYRYRTIKVDGNAATVTEDVLMDTETMIKVFPSMLRDQKITDLESLGLLAQNTTMHLSARIELTGDGTEAAPFSAHVVFANQEWGDMEALACISVASMALLDNTVDTELMWRPTEQTYRLLRLEGVVYEGKTAVVTFANSEWRVTMTAVMDDEGNVTVTFAATEI